MQVRMKSASAAVADAAGSAVEVKGVKVLAQRVDGLEQGADAGRWSTSCAASWARVWWCWARRRMGRSR